jgi:plastocyanin
MRRNVLLVIILVFVAVVLAACGGQEPEPVTYQVEMSEYAFSPNTLEAKVGQEVTIELTNSGLLEHELMIGRDVMMMDNRPNGFEHDMFGDAGVEPVVAMPAMEMQEGEHSEDEAGHEHEGFMVALPAESMENATITFTVTEDMVGEWEMGCFLQEGVHYDAGMKGKFIVTK